ncbi:hypothetical protein [Salinicola sp. RZ23]|uniref:hypothetical protein n=1 Tax=Salinicola sp. RZ23 TaxID=1949087 RepID=UPI000DA17160|nr:hypothetical protein [Salinicola sp. RZ23]
MKLSSLFTEERRQSAKKAARKTMKGSVAFSSALLFGTNESQGLLRTLGQASAEAGKNVWDALPENTSAAQSDSDETWQSVPDGYHHGPEGYGDYMGGYKISD